MPTHHWRNVLTDPLRHMQRLWDLPCSGLKTAETPPFHTQRRNTLNLLSQTVTFKRLTSVWAWKTMKEGLTTTGRWNGNGLWKASEGTVFTARKTRAKYKKRRDRWPRRCRDEDHELIFSGTFIDYLLHTTYHCDLGTGFSNQNPL